MFKTTQSRLCDGRYELLDRVGVGGTGEVWRAIDTRLKAERAIKVMPIPPSDVARQRQVREARVLAALESSHVVTVFDTFEEAGHQCVVMELCEESAAQRVARDGPLPVPEVLRVGMAVLKALERAHTAGVVHRDIKPNNLLFTMDDAPKVADFGLAWVREDPASLTQTGAVLGSIPFMSPEQRRGEPAGPQSDLYSLAATLLFLATGAVPGDLYVESTWERASRLAYPLVRVLGRAGRLDPGERFGSAEEMGAALQAIGADGAGQGEAGVAADGFERSHRVPRSARGAPRGALAGAVALAVGGFGLAWWQATSGWGGPLGQALPGDLASQAAYLALPTCEGEGGQVRTERYPNDSNDPPGLREAQFGMVRDVDQDGHADILVDHLIDETIRIFWGDGTGGLEEFTDVRMARLNGPFDAGDLDGDGWLDLVGTLGSGGVAVAWGGGEAGL